MANKRIPEMRPITATELNPADLMPVSDVSAHETKKVSLSDLSSYLVNVGTITASLYGTSSWASNTVSSAFAMNAATATSANTATRATSSISASWASSSLSSSYIATSSVAITASYALTGGTVGSGTTLVTGALYPITTSWALSSSRAATSSYVKLTANSQLDLNGLDLAGACQVLSSGYAQFADANVIITVDGYLTAQQITGSLRGTASWASKAITASNAITASHALNTITASYALVTGVAATTMKDYGIALATSSLRSASISSVTLTSNALSECNTTIECWGTATVKYTGSRMIDETVELIALNRWSGITSSLDKTSIGLVTEAGQTGSFTLPFSLAGQASLTPDSYVYYVTTSISTSLHTLRTPRFNTVSTAESVTYGSGETMQLKTSTITDTIIAYSASVGPMTNTVAAFLAADSASGLRYIDASSVNGSISYAWTLPVLTAFVASSNPSLTDVGGMPPSLVTMSVINTGVTELAPLTYTTTSLLLCSTNQLTLLPALPPSMSYIDCSTNPLTRLPTVIPYGVRTFVGDSIDIASSNTSLPSTLVSMSFQNCIYLTTWNSSIPAATKWVTFNGSSGLTDVSQYFIANNLDSNGALNGYLNLVGTQDLTAGPTSSSLATALTNLTGKSWTVTI